MRNFCIVLATFLSISALNLQAQEKKQLTLSDAVLQQYGSLGPNNVRGLDWLNETTYIYRKGNGEDEKLFAFDLKKNKERELLSLISFREGMQEFGLEIKGMPRFQRVADNLLAFQVGGAYFLFNASKSRYKAYNNDIEGISDVHFSSDASAMTYVKAENLYATSLDGTPLQITTDGSFDLVYGKAASRFEFGISAGTFWSPNSEGFAFYRNDQSEVPTYPLVDLTKIPAEHTPIKYPMAGGPSEKVTVEVSYKDGNVIRLNTNPEEDAYVCSVNWTPDGKQIILVTLNREQNHAKFQRMDAMSGQNLGTEYEEEDERYVEPLHNLIFLNENGSDYVYLSQKDGWMHAYRKTESEEVQLTKGTWVITKYLGMSEDKKFLYFEGTGENPTENHIYKVDLKTASFKRISKNHGTYHAALSPGANYMVTYFSSIDTPKRTLIADEDGVVVKSLLENSDPLEEYNVSRPELLTMTNDEGLILHARMIKPYDFDETKKYPALVYVYNGPHAQMNRNQWWGGAPLWMNYFANKGYIVFTVDGRGSYNRGKDFEQCIHRQVGTLEMLDQLAGAKFLKSLPYVDGDRLAVHGWSYGGFMTASLMLNHPDYFKVGVAGGPVTDWSLYEVMYTERYMDDPETNLGGFMASNLSNHVTNLRGKLLLIHGLSDDVVVPQHNFNLIRAFVDAGKQVDFFTYPGHAHNVRGKDRVHLMEKVLDYIETNLE